MNRRTPEKQFRRSGIISGACLIAAILLTYYIVRTTGWLPRK